MNRRNDYPYWVYPTRRAFHLAKRAHARAVKRALEDLRLGIAFVPGFYEHWEPMMKHFRALTDGMRPENWK